MQINYNTPNFTGLVKVKPQSFENLGKDIIDSAEIASRASSSIPSSGATFTTMAPVDTVSNLGIGNLVKQQCNRIIKLFNRITNRNITPFEITDKAASKELAKSSAAASTGSGLVSTGLGSYGSAAASGMDQTVNYPISGSGLIPRDFVHAHSNNALEDWAYNSLYNRRGWGNESATSPMTTVSGGGFFSQLLGSELLRNPKEGFTKAGDTVATKMLS